MLWLPLLVAAAATAALIHRDANFTFVHVGKTGGSSVRAMLRREGFLGVRTRWHSGGVVYNAPYRAPPGGRASWPLRVSPGERYVIVLRNPVERFASAFYDLKTKYRKWRPRLDRGVDWGGFSRDEDAMLRPHATLDAFVAAMPIRVDPCRFAHGRACCCGCAGAPWSTCPVAHVRQNIDHYVRHLANHGDQILAVLTQHTLTEDVRRVFGVDMARHARVNRNPHAAIAPATVGKLAPLLAADFAAIRLLRRMGHLTDAQFDHLMHLPNATAARRLAEADPPCERAFEAAGARDGWATGPAVRAYCEREGLMRSLGRETLARVWAQVDVNRDMRGIQLEAFCRFLRLLETERAASPLAANDVCYRACRDGSKPPIARRDDCPPGTACRATQPPGLYLDNCAAPDTCQARSDAAPVRNASGAPGSGSAVACTSTSDPHLRKFVGLRCCRDRATREPYTIHIGHANGGFRGLTHAAMYEPARETLRRGFLARADECGYSVATYFGPLKPETLRDGDVVISFGMNGPYAHGFARAASELRQRPIAFINYDTEPGGLRPAKKVGMLLPRHHRRRGPGGQMTELWSHAFSHRAKANRIKIVRFPVPETEPGPVRVFKWLGMAGRCMDRLPPDVRRRVWVRAPSASPPSRRPARSTSPTATAAARSSRRSRPSTKRRRRNICPRALLGSLCTPMARARRFCSPSFRRAGPYALEPMSRAFKRGLGGLASTDLTCPHSTHTREAIWREAMSRPR